MGTNDPLDGPGSSTPHTNLPMLRDKKKKKNPSSWSTVWEFYPAFGYISELKAVRDVIAKMYNTAKPFFCCNDAVFILRA